jgi:hypothetical protein
MPKTINVSGVGPLQFPDEMTEEQIAEAIDRNLPSLAPELLKDPKVRDEWSNRRKQQAELETWREASAFDRHMSDVSRMGRSGGETIAGTIKGVGTVLEAFAPAALQSEGFFQEAEQLNQRTGEQILADRNANPIVQTGQQLQDATAKAFPRVQPESESRIFGAIGEGVGSIGGSLIAGPFSLATGTLAEVNDAYEREIERQHRENEPLDPEKAFTKASLYGAVTIPIEMGLGIGRILRQVKKYFSPEDAATAGSRLLRGGKEAAMEFIKERAKDSGAGFSQEFSEALIQDLIVEGHADLAQDVQEGLLGLAGQTTVGGVAHLAGGAANRLANGKQQVPNVKKEAKTEPKAPAGKVEQPLTEEQLLERMLADLPAEEADAIRAKRKADAAKGGPVLLDQNGQPMATGEATLEMLAEMEAAIQRTQEKANAEAQTALEQAAAEQTKEASPAPAQEAAGAVAEQSAPPKKVDVTTDLAKELEAALKRNQGLPAQPAPVAAAQPGTEAQTKDQVQQPTPEQATATAVEPATTTTPAAEPGAVANRNPENAEPDEFEPVPYSDIEANEGPTAARLVKALNKIGIFTIDTHGSEGRPIHIRIQNPFDSLPWDIREALMRLGKVTVRPENALENGVGATGITFDRDVSTEIAALEPSPAPAADTIRQQIAEENPEIADLVDVVDGPEQFPQEVQDDASRRSIALERVDAVADGGRVIVNAQQFRNNPQKVRDKMVHEVAIHHGLRRAIGRDKLRQLFHNIWQGLDEQDRKAIAERNGIKWSGTMQIGEEWLAYEAERVAREGKTNPMWQRVVAQIKVALRQYGFFSASKLSDVEIAVLIAKGWRGAKEGAKQGSGNVRASVADGGQTVSGAPATPHSPAGGPRFSVESFETGNWQERFTAAANKAGYSKRDINGSLNLVRAVVDLFKAHPDVLPQAGATNSRGEKLKTLVDNADFGMTLDVNRLCKRVMRYHETVDAVQKQIGRPISENELLALGQQMRKDGDIPFCIFCYVEASRRAANRNAYAFVMMSPDEVRALMEKTGNKTMKLIDYVVERDRLLKEIGMSQRELGRLVVNRDAAARALQKGGARGELVKLFTKYVLGAKGTAKTTNGTYDGEVAELTDQEVLDTNERAGMRWLSATDLDPTQLVDTMQALVDSQARGLAGHEYTKEPYTALIFGLTGMKINLSIAMNGREPGKFTDDVVNGMPHDVAMRLRSRFPNAGTMAVAKNVPQLDWMLAHPSVDQIIPHHAANWSDRKFEAFDLDDFATIQSEDWIDKKKAPTYVDTKGNTHTLSPKKAFGNKMWFTYWLRKTNGDEQVAARAYVEFAAANNFYPKFGYPPEVQSKDAKIKFRDYSKDPNYYKLLKDFARTDSPQETVDATRVDRKRLTEYAKRFIDQGGWAQREKPNPATVNRFVEMLREGEVIDLAATEQEITDSPPTFRGVDTPLALGISSWKQGTLPTETPAASKPSSQSGKRGPGGLRYSVSEEDRSHELRFSANPSYPLLTQEEIPTDTQTAYKLMRIYRNRPRELFPLYARPDEGQPQGFTIGPWYRAVDQRPTIGNRLLAQRSGIHAVDLPIFSQGKAKVKGEQRVWVEVEMPTNDPKTQAESDSSPLLDNGQREGIRKRLIGPKEAYNFKTNPTATGAGSWPIAGSAKFVRVLSDEDVRQILAQAGAEEHIENSMTGLTNDSVIELGYPISETTPKSGMPRYSVSEAQTEILIELGVVRPTRAKYKRVNWGRMADLGTTEDFREAGYIAPEGQMIDLSGKSEGGPQGMRSYDHREVGGTAGMIEAMAAGFVRTNFSSSGDASVDILTKPTRAQTTKLYELFLEAEGNVSLDLGNGLGVWDQRNEMYGDPKRTWANEYSNAEPEQIIEDIQAFYEGRNPGVGSRRFSISEPGSNAETAKQIASTVDALNAALDRQSGFRSRSEKVPDDLTQLIQDLTSRLNLLKGWTEDATEAAAGGSPQERIPHTPPELRQQQLELEGATDPERKPFSEWWDSLKTALRYIASPVPEIPLTGDAARKSAAFLRGFRLFAAESNRVKAEAGEKVANVLEPLQKLGRTRGQNKAVQQFYKLADALSRARAQGKDAAAERIAKKMGKLEELGLAKDPFHIFRLMVLYRDLWWRGTFLKTEKGEPITLPNNLTVDEVAATLRRLTEQLEAHPDKDAIAEALRRHYALTNELQKSILDHGEIIPEALRNPLYFPHHILENWTGQMDRVKPSTEDDFRRYLIAPVGSGKLVQTDYLKAMYLHTADVLAHNARVDLVQKYWQSYDISNRLRTEFEDQWDKPWNIPPGYRLFSPFRKLPLRMDYIISREVLAEKLGVMWNDGDLRARLGEAGKVLDVSPEDLHSALVAGEKIKWVLPDHIADALDGITRREAAKANPGLGHTLGTPARWLNNFWKRVKLFAPWNWLRYEYGNTITDVIDKVMVADPKVAVYLPQAAREILTASHKGTKSEEFKAAAREGVFETITAGEAGELSRLREFAEFQTTAEHNKSILHRFLSATTRASHFREATFRYAKFLADVERMRKGQEPVTAGAYHGDIRALGEPVEKGAAPVLEGDELIYAKAAEISLKTFGDYNSLGVVSQWLRTYAVPFWSWQDVNFRYHANQLRNIADGLRGIKGGSPRDVTLKWSAVRVVSFLTLVGIIQQAWNQLGGPMLGLWDDDDDLEGKLSAADRRRSHILLGKDAEGKAMIVYTPAAFSDTAEWFGGQNFKRLFIEWARGDITLQQFVSDYAKQLPADTLNKVAQSFGPLVKAPYEAVSGKSVFPDVTDQRTIVSKEKWWRMVSTMTDDRVVNWARQVFDKEYYAQPAAEQLQQMILQVRRRDAEQWAYYETLDRSAEWKEARTGKRRDGGDYDSPDEKVLRNFRRAIYRADVPSAVKFYEKLQQYGYTAERLDASIRAQHPLRALNNEERKEFVAGLTAVEKKQLALAEQYYSRMQILDKRERQLFPTRNQAKIGIKKQNSERLRELMEERK